MANLSRTLKPSMQNMSASTTAMWWRRQRAQFWRGGTSNAVIIKGDDLLEWRSLRQRYPGSLDAAGMKLTATTLEPLLQAIMGSPDPYGRQLNGMGGGISSLSKAMIVDKAYDDRADVDYLFIQVGSKCVHDTAGIVTNQGHS